ncbi:hypothetical protein SEUCBS139899_008054 [Sporothrix eucalyptigena]|uniref:SigF-like NTF2-like domain-containing protein n=1 Tax=Sporothrix eucalyptigena TaxID=1812306 RepID=A0ABP0CRX0_9PEZI
MENPALDIKEVITTLCTKPQAEQQAAIRQYYLPNAEFVHPLCRMPRFGNKDATINNSYRHSAKDTLTTVNSRRIIAAIFRWYKILSPNITLGVESVAWDPNHHTLFVAMHQRFALWFVPMYAAHVRLVVELQLEAHVVGNRHDGSSYAAVAAAHAANYRNGNNGTSTHISTANTARGRQLVNSVSGTSSHPPRTLYYIARHEDHYQINEVLKFFTLSFGAWLWALVQLVATAMCVGGAAVVDTALGGFLGTKKKVVGKKQP